ncbi:hypothetical protein [Belnapia mucosa]|nr:hypothetical protein [Belnapia mucosa]
MAPRLALLLLLCPVGACASPEDRAAELRLAFERGQAQFAAMPATAARPLPAAAPVLVDAAPVPAAAPQLLGLGPEPLRRWLGEPSLRRAEGDAEVWLYAGPACALDLVLYPQGGRLRVAHASARASGTEPRTEAHCLRELAGLRTPPTDRGI